MKYVNSLKYMNSFEAAGGLCEISQKRIRELCVALGRINLGTSSIFLPSGSAGHATAVMLESVIKDAGYKVGRVTSIGGYDSRAVVLLDGEIVPIEEYNRAVAELKATLINFPDEVFFKEEVSFALALLLCKMHGCEYVIFEGTSGDDHSFDAICAPYDLVVIPTVLDENELSTKVVCDAIKRGTREVISGNQKKSVYETVSNACVTGGIRLSFTSKLGFEVETTSSIKLGFSYSGRDGYIVKSPSLLQRDCAMLVIESALAIRRDGIKLPWTSISAGLASATGAGCFEVLSVSPLVIVDSAATLSEAELLISTMDEVVADGLADGLCLCIPANRSDLTEAFKEKKLLSRILVGNTDGEILEDSVVCDDAVAGAKELFALIKEGKNIVSLGSVEFANEIKAEILKRMNA